MQVAIHTYRAANGAITHLGSDGHLYEPLQGLGFISSSRINQIGQATSALARNNSAQSSRGGFLDNVIKTASGLFRKKDGSNTFIGDTVQKFADSFGQKLGTQVGTQGQINQGVFSPGMFASPGQSQLPVHDPRGDNPLPPKKDNTVLWVVGSTLALGLVGTGIYMITQQNKSGDKKKSA